MNRRELFLQGAAAFVAPALLPAVAKPSVQGAHAPLSQEHRWVHPGVLQRNSDLAFMKAQVLAGRDPWKAAWDRMLALPTSSLGFVPEPVAHIVRGSYGAGQKGDRELNASIAAARSHVLQWIVTGGEEHAQKTAAILDAWSVTLADFSGNDSMLLGGWTGGQWADIGEILRATWKGWSTAGIRQFEQMLRTIYVPLLSPLFPEANGNWDAAMMHSLLGIAVFCEDGPLFHRVLLHYRYGPGSSGITRYVYPNGQCEESTRDMAHTQLGLGYFALSSLIAWNQKVDLFGEASDRLALGFEYTARYMLDESVFAYGSISAQSRDRIDDWYELPLQHFRYDRGYAMPFTEQAAAKARDRSRSVLTMFRGQDSAQSKYPPPQPSKVAFEAGASLKTQVLAGAAVQPGQSIQDALDRAATHGGLVLLAAGLHTLDAPLAISSGVTLAGMGRATVLFLDGKKAGPALLTTDAELHDVTIRNMLIEAGPLAMPTRDPNQDRRPLATQLVMARGGIVFIADRGKTFHRITVERVSIRNATLSAIEIFGADGVIVTACDLSASGGAVAPGAGKHHCLKLTHVSNAVVAGSRLVDSFHGCGLAVAFGKAITVRDCEAARNSLDGVQLAECDGVEMTRCLAEGNGNQGIAQPVWMDPSIHVTLRDNLLQNNGAMQTPPSLV